MHAALLTLYRSLTRHRLYAVLTIGALALGIAVFLVLMLFVRFETGFDRSVPDWQRIWVVKRTLQFPGSPEMSIPSRPEMLANIRAYWRDVDGARMLVDDVPVQNGASVVRERVAQVDAGYFSLFPSRAIAGTLSTALATPDAAVVTERIATTYLGSGSPIGRTLTLVIAGKPTPFKVTAVITDPASGLTYRNAILTALPRDDGPIETSGGTLTTFVRFADTESAACHVGQFPALLRRRPDPNMTGLAADVLKQTLVPLGGVHLADPRDRTVVGALGIVGALALLIAVANYVNLSTARAGLRAREVAIRKVVGATRGALVGQFVGEALVTAGIAGLVGLALAELALPLVNAAGGTTLAMAYLGAGSILPPLGLLIVVVALSAGIYPAILVSRFQPAAVLASVRAPGGQRTGALVRRAMVVVQFAIAVALMIGTAVLVAQTRHLQTSDLGFERSGLIGVPSFADATLDDSQRRAMVAAIAQIPGVVSTTQAAVAPTGGSFAIGAMHRDGAVGPDPMIVRANVSSGFFATYGARLLAGRFLDSARFRSDLSKEDAQNGPSAIVINRSAAAQLGFATPEAAVGQTVGAGDDARATIVGVIDDMRFKSPRDLVEPQAYYDRGSKLSRPVLTVRYGGDDMADTARIIVAMEGVWRRIAPVVPFNALPVDRQLYEAYYRADAQRSRLFMIGAVLAVAIGCIGLYGLAAFDSLRRIKEIGIRKTLGASSGDVLLLLIGQFLKPVLLANVIALPLAYWVMRRWLAGFDDRVALSPWLFGGAAAVAAGVAVATILGQTLRVARSEPSRALRYE